MPSSSYDRCYVHAVKAAALGMPWACHRVGCAIQANGQSFGIRGIQGAYFLCNIAPGVELYLFADQQQRDIELRSGGIVTLGWPIPSQTLQPRRSAEIALNKDVKVPAEKIDYMKAVREMCGGR